MKLSPTQKKAILAIAAEVHRKVKRGYTQAEVKNQTFGYGPGTEFTRATVTALKDRGLVLTHAGPPTARPSKAGFGRPANARTIVEANLWFTLTPYFLDAILTKGKK